MVRFARKGIVAMFGLACLPSLAMAAGKCERLVATGSPDAPPYSWRDPQDPRHLIGANVDLLKQVAAELGLKVEVLYSGKRSEAQDQVRSGRMDLLVDAPLAVGELGSVDYIHPPVLQNDYVVWTRHDSALVYENLGDLHKHQGAISEKARLTPEFARFSETGLKLTPVPNLTQAMQKLLLGQVDYVLAGRYAGMAMAQSLGMANDLVVRGQPLDHPGLFLALSHNSACNDGWLRGQLAKKLTELPASGVVQAVVQRSVERWQAQLQAPLDAPKQ